MHETRQAAAQSNLAELVATVMAEEDLTLRVVAERGGLSLASVAALRAGTRGKRPRRDTLTALARGLGVPVEHVLAAARGVERELEHRLLSAFRRLEPDGRQRALVLVESLVPPAERAAPGQRRAD